MKKVSNQSQPNVKASTKPQKEAPKAWKERISTEQYQKLRDIFLLFDEDGSGTIDPQEIVKVLQQMGLDKKNQNVLRIVWAMRQTNKIIDLEQFIDIVCSKVGEVKSKDGLQRLFKLYDKEDTGKITFQELKQITRSIGQQMTDDDILELMHGVFIIEKTSSNQQFSFEQFYQIISNFYNKHPV